MDIKILDSWLRDYLETKATPEKIAEYLSLCGPSIERVEKIGKDYVYDIEVTTNRIDSFGVLGIAREAQAILPRFGVDAKLKNNIFKNSDFKFVKKVSYLDAEVDTKLCPRFTSVVIRNVEFGKSTELIQKRLEASGIRSINNIVDISNYIMLALGQPVHTFDYDKIVKGKMILREAKKGEKITTLDGKTFTLPGGDIVIEDGNERLIDLAGIMGGALSAVTPETKNVLLFVQSYNPESIRKTSMALAQRTDAATIFEKGTDPEKVTDAILMGIDLFKKMAKGTPEKEILDIYPSPYKPTKISLNHSYIESKIGGAFSPKDITKYLNSLSFETKWNGKNIEVTVPSFRAKDVTIPEDVVEEVARIYGYQNLPSIIMNGKLTARTTSKSFEFEEKIKNILSGWGGVEVYTLSLVPKSFVNKDALKLKNPLGIESEYLRTSLMPSLVSAAKENFGKIDSFHLFEMANIYEPRKNDLPKENLILAGIFSGFTFREAKGVIEALMQKLNIDAVYTQTEEKYFKAGRSISVFADQKLIGKFGEVEDSELFYYEFGVDSLASSISKTSYKEISKYPPQIEDITFVFPTKTKIGEVIASATSINSNRFQRRIIEQVELKDIYKDSYTLRVWYQDRNKTLTNQEVENVRKELLAKIKSKFDGVVKE